MAELFVGLMSGTSLDGVDAVLVRFVPGPEVLAHTHLAFDAALRDALLRLNAAGEDELHRAALAGNALARAYAHVVGDLLERAGVGAAQVRAIGVHGQTVRHRPGEFDALGYTIQLGNPALLAEASGIDVVADFRSRDLAAGGQGAPLVPAFHRAVFARPGEALAVLNLGGIANLTLVDADGATIGFDCGPANALMDAWCLEHTGRAFDAAGAWAAGGTVIEPLLGAMLREPFFAKPPPKSTGRDLFHAGWLDARLQALGRAALAQDVQATLAELTARCAAQAVQAHGHGAAELLVCGGGALNAHLMRRLGALLPDVHVQASDARGLPAMQVEACAFAWLARAFLQREPGNIASVTGARGARVLGALYPAR